MSRVVTVAWCLVAVPLSAADPAPRDLLPETSTLRIELHRPTRFLDHRRIRDAWAAIGESSELRRRLESPELDRLRQAKAFLERATETDCRTALDRLTAGGVALSLDGRPGEKPNVTLAAVADDEETLRRVVAAFQTAVLERVPADRRPLALPSETYQGVECTQVGDARFAVVGRTLIASNRSEGLRAAIDRLSAAPRPDNDGEPILRLDVDLARLRESPQFQKGLAIPSNDIGQVFVLGGWVDVLSRSKRVRVELSAGDAALELRLRIDAGRTGSPPGLKGYFASEPGARALPPLQLPGTIASSSWHRDYAAMWAGRDTVLTPEAKARLEDGDSQLKKQFEVVGARFLPSELFADMGTHFRFVLARQSESVYKVELPEKLPAAVFLVDMRRAAFREKLTPLLRFGGILAAADGRRMITTTETYHAAELTSFRFREDAETQAMGDRNRYQISPTWTFTRNHLIVGSTAVIVRQAIDALDAQAAENAPLPEFTTESQIVSPAAAAAALNDFRSALLNATVLNNGLSLDEAERELSVVIRALEALRSLSTRATFDDETLEVQVRIGE